MRCELGPVESWLWEGLGRPRLLVLVDPDRAEAERLDRLAAAAPGAGVAAFLAGTSLLSRPGMGQRVGRLKQRSGLPVILFPGDASQVVGEADAILFLSLISGRNPQYLIGEQVRSAPLLAASGIECLPTGYLLVESGTTTSAQFMSGSQPLPRGKPDIAAAHAQAARALGLRQLYLEAGSGARLPVPAEMIRAVKEVFPGPLIVGGGLREPADLARAATAGADLVVGGSRLETCPLEELESELAALAGALARGGPR
ncbi:MAG: phosphoglycerol geranylgeranyltransferase [bacterium]|nr:phosphoglycerol geranylgeranyltransferase [bacterium]